MQGEGGRGGVRLRGLRGGEEGGGIPTLDSPLASQLVSGFKAPSPCSSQYF